ncbi:MAG TPA: formylglycine-generating enzyme family protein [Saprospiraceae bacterium]|nr:formylglycine-generating enzyme family protein [Saprospiraceae bacterium]
MDIYTETFPSGFSFDMIHVEGGAFRMGGDDPEATGEEKPVHEVTVPAFYLGKFPVTQGLWKAVMGNNPSYFKGDLRPVETVSWVDAQGFIKRLNSATEESRKKQGLGPYRLPTEAEWEFAARGGAYPEGYLYAGSDKLKEVGWYDENSNNQTQDVGLLMGNELGLYDLSGNVYEWTEDHWHENYKDNPPADGSAWLSADPRAPRVVRGGYYFYNAGGCRVSYRDRNAPGIRNDGIGFRLALSPRPAGQSGPAIP